MIEALLFTAFTLSTTPNMTVGNTVTYTEGNLSLKSTVSTVIKDARVHKLLFVPDSVTYNLSASLFLQNDTVTLERNCTHYLDRVGPTTGAEYVIKLSHREYSL